MKNALTIDVEDWYHTMDFNFDIESWGSYEDRIEYSLNILLDLLSRHNIKATFFVLGYIAKKHPVLIREIARQGHEVGSHGTWHRMVFNQSKEEFREDIRYSKGLLEDIIGHKIDLFRSSSWSISKKSLWALNILEEEGFTCDSSVQPFPTPLSGMKGAPKVPFYPIINNRKLNLIEFPPTILNFSKIPIPFAGGLYLRIFPFVFIKHALKKVNSHRNGMIYVHPWEFDVEQPKLDVSNLVKFTHYYNLKSNTSKLDNLIKNFEFVPIGEIIKEGKFPAITISSN